MSDGPVELDATIAAWVEAARAATGQIAYYTEIRDRAYEQIQAAMGDAVEATIGGRPAVSWKLSKPSLRLDRNALEKTYGTDTIAQFLVESKAARPFKIIAVDDQ